MFPNQYDIYGQNLGAAPWLPPAPVFVGFGYDPEQYISTAQLAPTAYTDANLVAAKISLPYLNEACDDSQPPTGLSVLQPTINGNQPNPVYQTFQNVLQSVTTELNGYLSAIYPSPLAQTGTVAVIQITGVDANGAVTSIQVLENGNYKTAPATPNSPAYLRYHDPLQNAQWFGTNWQQCQHGSGLSLTVAFTAVNYSDESGQLLQAQTVNGTPTIAAGGTNYVCGQIIVLTGGTSVVPAKVRQACLDLVCHTLYKRRLAPDEKNPFSTLAKFWRDLFSEIAEGEKQLDGTYKRFYSAGMSWNSQSVLAGANSL